MNLKPIESLKVMGPKVWNCLSNELKSVENLNSFKKMIKQWIISYCACADRELLTTFTLLLYLVYCKFLKVYLFLCTGQLVKQFMYTQLIALPCIKIK